MIYEGCGPSVDFEVECDEDALDVQQVALHGIEEAASLEML